MVNDAVNSGHRGHGVFEDPYPVTEDQIRGYDHASSLVTFGQEREEHLHLIAVVLHVSYVVEDQAGVAIKLGQQLRQSEIALCRQELLDEGGRGVPAHSMPLQRLGAVPLPLLWPEPVAV